MFCRLKTSTPIYSSKKKVYQKRYFKTYSTIVAHGMCTLKRRCEILQWMRKVDQQTELRIQLFLYSMEVGIRPALHIAGLKSIFDEFAFIFLY